VPGGDEDLAQEADQGTAEGADRSSWRNGPRKSDTITAQMSSAHTVQREMAQLMSRARRERTTSSDRMSGANLASPGEPGLDRPAAGN
jgi:hypothetical protein